MFSVLRYHGFTVSVKLRFIYFQETCATQKRCVICGVKENNYYTAFIHLYAHLKLFEFRRKMAAVNPEIDASPENIIKLSEFKG